MRSPDLFLFARSNFSPIVSRDVPECGGATFPWEISSWASSPPVSLAARVAILLLGFLSFFGLTLNLARFAFEPPHLNTS